MLVDTFYMNIAKKLQFQKTNPSRHSFLICVFASNTVFFMYRKSYIQHVQMGSFSPKFPLPFFFLSYWVFFFFFFFFFVFNSDNNRQHYSLHMKFFNPFLFAKADRHLFLSISSLENIYLYSSPSEIRC